MGRRTRGISGRGGSDASPRSTRRWPKPVGRARHGRAACCRSLAPASGRARASLRLAGAGGCRLLGGALRSGDLARYAEPRADGARLVAPREGRLELRRGDQARRASLHGRPGRRPRGGGPAARRPRRRRGGAANAGLGGGIDRISRRAQPRRRSASRSSTRGRGSPSESRSSALEPVQQMLADAATLIEGLRAARRRPARR